MAKLNSEKRKKSSFYEEKSLVGLTPDCSLSSRNTDHVTKMYASKKTRE
jgi:hypothetical protein